MALHIEDVHLLVLAVGLLVGHAVHKHTGAAVGDGAKGDLVGAIGAAAAVITVRFLLPYAGGSAQAGPDSRTAGHALASHQVSAVRAT
ncbi:hypothetical protein ACFCXA_27505 [Streptomyces virginiae]|uniref:hypothetical protein n=1 Tax=Streptomyces virginiae TaxID=1961 RepID=UPI0032461300